MNLLYLYKASNDGELRYSLRSAERYLEPVEEVWIVGDRPEWLSGAYWIPGGEKGVDKFGTLFSDLLLACRRDDVPDEFVLMNDDFHVLAPFTPAIEHHGSLSERLAAIKRVGQFPEMLASTLQWLRARGYDDPPSYELHRPMPIVKCGAAAALEQAAARNALSPLGARTVYAVAAGLGGVQVIDKKLRGDSLHDPWRSLPLISTSDDAWIGSVGRWLRAQLPEPSRWER